MRDAATPGKNVSPEMSAWMSVRCSRIGRDQRERLRVDPFAAANVDFARQRFGDASRARRE